MGKGERIRRMLPVLMCALLVLLSWGYALKRGEAVLKDLQIDQMSFYRDGKRKFSLSNGDVHGVLNSGPGLTLQAGRYQLRMTLTTDGDNQMRIVTGNGARVTQAEFDLPAYGWYYRCNFELLDDARDLEFLIDFQEGESITLQNIQLVMYNRTDSAWTVTLIALLACTLYGLALRYRQGRLTQDDLGRLMLMSAAVLVASFPLLREGLYGGDDTLFHQMRLYNVADALRTGQFPVRMGGYGYNGYGSAVSIFYPDVLLLPPALMMCMGATAQYAMRTYIIAMNVLSAATMYICAKRIFQDRTAGTCASILYTLSHYRLIDVYLRDALGEYTAMAVLPLFMLGLWEVLFGDAKRWRTLVLGATLVFMSHMLTTAMCAAGAVLACIPCAAKIIRERRYTAILKAIAATALLNLFLLVPMLDYSRQGIGAELLKSSCSLRTLTVAQVFAVQRYNFRSAGYVPLLAAIATVYGALMGFGERSRMRSALCLAAAGMATALAATNLFPWELAERLTKGMINYLQFPFRLFTFTALLLTLAGGYTAVCFFRDRKYSMLPALLVFLLCVVSASSQIGAYAMRDANSVHRWDDRLYHYKSDTEFMADVFREYALPNSDLSATKELRVLVGGTAELTDFCKRGTTMTAQVNAQTDVQLTLPVFGFDGYRATLDGKALETGLGDNNRLTVLLPAGAQGSLRVWFAGKPVWRAAEAVSLLTLLALLWSRRTHTINAAKVSKIRDERKTK